MLSDYLFCVYSDEPKCEVRNVIKNEGFDNVVIIDNEDVLLKQKNIDFLFVCKNKKEEIFKILLKIKYIFNKIKIVCIMDEYDPYLSNNMISKGCDYVIYKENVDWVDEIKQYINDIILIEENKKHIDKLVYKDDRRKRKIRSEKRRRFLDLIYI